MKKLLYGTLSKIVFTLFTDRQRQMMLNNNINLCLLKVLTVDADLSLNFIIFQPMGE